MYNVGLLILELCPLFLHQSSLIPLFNLSSIFRQYYLYKEMKNKTPPFPKNSVEESGIGDVSMRPGRLCLIASGQGHYFNNRVIIAHYGCP